MSLNKTLDRLFDEIRREAKRNPDFADRLDAVLQRHDSRRDVAEDVLDEVARDEDAPVATASGRPKRNKPGAVVPSAPQPSESVASPVGLAPEINPAGVFRKGGEDGLRAALADQDLSALRALVAEHNLDPSGVTPSLTRDELAAHIVAQAKRRAERDEKMFDY
ncbi:hypothetical protein [Candidatus Viadribacter manganicus]|uniref:Uncharacterized protein n=1 Tax=Candidatus Viadribacter manganicus TaxID=1759059 RepID=A0A1B1ALI4_9PROT|nr:hypothetical protein [Candidatus Viadribacter manganicus]ANP47436.1 hypothetical protein ATE48_16715 [Candidatus Viadribacter manganicus]